MSDPRRLIEGGDSDTTGLLRAAMADGPSKRAERNAAAALGIAVVGASSATAGAAGAAVGAAGTATVTAGSGGAMATLGSAAGGLTVLGKVMAVAAIVGATSAGVAYQRTSISPRAKIAHAASSPSASEFVAPAFVAPVARVAPVASVAPVAPVASGLAPTPEALKSPEPPEPAAVVAPRTASPHRPSAAALAVPAVATLAPPVEPIEHIERTPSSLRAETRELDAARGALEANDAAGALRALDTYARDFPNGLLAPEAALLRIESLSRGGDHQAARRLAESFVASYPHSPLAARAMTFVTPRVNP